MSFFTKEHRALSPILIANSFLFFGNFIMIFLGILKHKSDPSSYYGQTPVKSPLASNSDRSPLALAVMSAFTCAIRAALLGIV